jgi:3-hydroxyisobutyrate dehydrogenase-like beta-hydroxyacid dehydrogenase
MGSVGTGQAVKLLNNMTAVCNLVLVQDTLQIGQELGIDRGALTSALLTGSAASRMLDTYRAFDFDPLLQRNPQWFLRDWSRIRSDLRFVLDTNGVDGRLLDSLGTIFIERTTRHVDQRV